MFRPRLSVRRMLDLRFGMAESAMLVVFGYALSEIFSRLIVPELVGGRGLESYLFELLGTGLGVILFAALICWPPQIFGGKGVWEDSLRASAWLSVLTSVISPLFLFAEAALPQGLSLADILSNPQAAADGGSFPPGVGTALMMVLLYGFWSLWLTASCIAEVHRFRSTWTVFVVMIFINICFTIILGGLMR
ncbi:MAG: YIP1 family protein [Pseudomonadota bacterium]